MDNVNESGIPEQMAPLEGTLILGKYKTQKELEEAYSEVQAEFTRKSQELADTKRVLETLQTRQGSEMEAREEEDDDQLFFREPAKATQKVVLNALNPIYEFLYEQQKQTLRDNPKTKDEFAKYEAEVDTLIAMQPQLKVKPGVVAQAFRMVQGLHFNPDEFTRKVLADHQVTNGDKVAGGLEGVTAPGIPEKKEVINLTAEEKKVALRFNTGMPEEEAYKKYAEKKAKCGR